jgi:hypothetical protein
MKNTYSLGLITHNNIERFRECISYIPKMDNIPFIVVNDGNPYDMKDYRDDMIVLQHSNNKKIAKSKNDALHYLLTFDTEWIFIMENDMKILDHSVFEYYIEVANKSGLKHLNFALHGNDNWNEDRTSPKPRLIYEHGVSLYNYAGGCFQLYHKSVFEKVGFYDEFYKNCWEHLDLTFRTTLAGYHTPFWLSADVNNSHLFIEQIDFQEESDVSSGYKNPNYYEGLFYWKFKFGSWVANIPDWINDEYHTSVIIDMFHQKKYDELSELFMGYYRNVQSPYFNKEYKYGQVYENVWGSVGDDGKIRIFQN